MHTGGDADGLVVGVDLATAEARAACADASGRVRAAASSPLPPPTRPRAGWLEQDARGWWPAVAAALRRVSDRLGPERRRVVAVSVASTSGTVLVADARGDPVGPAILYADGRAEAEADAAQDAGGERWQALGVRIAPSFGLPKWAWLLHRAEEAARARFAWHASDLVVARLTGGPPPTDWSHALKSGYDPLRREWAVEALEALGVERRLLPEVLPPTASAGEVGRGASAETGLPVGCDVRLGMTDGCAGQLAAGAGRPGRFVGVLGTTFVLKGASSELVRDPAGAVYSHRHPDGWWLPGGASNTGGAALREWFADADLAEMDRRAGAFGPARCVVYPLTGEGERFPFVAPDARGFWLGSPADDVERYRAVLEGVAFLERLAYQHLERLGASVAHPLAAAGAGSTSAVWRAVRSTALHAPLVLAAHPETSFGACILAAAGPLHPTLTEAGRAMVRVAAQTDPDAAEADRLDDSYGRFAEAVRQRGWIDAGS